MQVPKLILASGSRYRQQQLRNAGFEFEVATSNIDESRQPNESPHGLAQRLAKEKANAVLSLNEDAIVIGADQVCAFREQALGKPGTPENAVQTLQMLANQVVVFHSAVAVVSATQSSEFSVPTEVELRELTQSEIQAYVALDSPLDTAGAIKSERSGSLLFNRVTSDDPTALIGLPLIRLAATLRDFGIDPLS